MRVTQVDPLAAAITGRCGVKLAPDCYQIGTTEGLHRIVYEVIFDNDVRAPAEAALHYGRQWAPNPIPRRGARMSLTDSGYRFENRSVFALDFLVYPKEPGQDFANIWHVEVTYREPVWGQDEVPATAHLNPLARAPEAKWDFLDVTEEVETGYKVTNGVPETTRTTIVNTFGQQMEPAIRAKRVPIVRILFNTNLRNLALEFNNDYTDTCNNAAIQIAGRKIEKYHARFLSCEQWDGGYWDGQKWWRCELRLEHSRTPLFDVRKSVGQTYKQGDAVKAPVDDRGQPYPGGVPLDADGNLAGESNPQAEVTYLTLDPVTYGRIGLLYR